MNLKLLNSNLRWTVVSLLLIAISWPGPWPVVHCHATLAASSDPVALAKHLEKSHLLANCAVDPNKPHIHWVFSFASDEVLETSPGNDTAASPRTGEMSPIVSGQSNTKQLIDRERYHRQARASCNLQTSISFCGSQKLRLRLPVSANVLFCSMTC